jgi:hypothetical protein
MPDVTDREELARIAEEQIRCIAYNLWKQEGCPQGHALENYFKAEAIILYQEQHGLVASSSSGLRTQTRSRVTSPEGS